MEWNFWATRHGKGPHDGVGACLKQTLRKEQLKPGSRRLQNAKDVIEFLKFTMNMPNLAYPRAKRLVSRHFIDIGEFEVTKDEALNCKGIAGSRSMYSIWSVSPTNNVLLEVREFSCFCEYCTKENPGTCPNKDYVEPWKLMTLEPIQVGDVVQDIDEVDPDLSLELDNNLYAT